jgi:O-antigen ligase
MTLVFVGVLMQKLIQRQASVRSSHDVDWQGALDAVIHHPLFGIGITLGAYQVVLAAYEKTRWIFLQPVLVSMLLVIGVLLLCGIDYANTAKAPKS